MHPPTSRPKPQSINLGQCRKVAKELVKGFAARDVCTLDYIRWNHPRFRAMSDDEIVKQRFALADAQLVVARLQHIESWPKLLAHVEALRRGDPAVLRFEHAVDAIVSGDRDTLASMLHGAPAIVHERSTRAHHSTLLHYVSANGVEDVRQVTPPNIVDIARLLLDSGAVVDATSGAYGGGSTTLMLTATSAHPRIAGVQNALLDLLIERGAQIGPILPGGGIVRSALANGCPGAAVHLIERGASANDLFGAAGLGRLDSVQLLFDAATTALREDALLVAAQCNRTSIVEYLLSREVNPRAYDGMTPLHWAAANGNIVLLERLLTMGADLERENEFGGSVLSSTLWFAHNATDGEFRSRDYPAAIEWLIAAGANTAWYDGMRRDIEAVCARARRLAAVT